MKRILLLGGVTAALALFACDDGARDLAEPLLSPGTPRFSLETADSLPFNTPIVLGTADLDKTYYLNASCTYQSGQKVWADVMNSATENGYDSVATDLRVQGCAKDPNNPLSNVDNTDENGHEPELGMLWTMGPASDDENIPEDSCHGRVIGCQYVEIKPVDFSNGGCCTDDDCSELAPYTLCENYNRNRCMECLVHGDYCAGGGMCDTTNVPYECVDCFVNNDCGVDSTCSDGNCVCDPDPSCTGTPCTTSADCGSNGGCGGAVCRFGTCMCPG